MHATHIGVDRCRDGKLIGNIDSCFVLFRHCICFETILNCIWRQKQWQCHFDPEVRPNPNINPHTQCQVQGDNIVIRVTLWEIYFWVYRDCRKMCRTNVSICGKIILISNLTLANNKCINLHESHHWIPQSLQPLRLTLATTTRCRFSLWLMDLSCSPSAHRSNAADELWLWHVVIHKIGPKGRINLFVVVLYVVD